ncbi:ParB/RepB/Spo0J family partition protein [Companilactobacillus furfuricola]|uniref:ParB/RepB/Spo0J family partition protein n=1 Tax=Companilactobacillus furfuricola TaxID=1462575 RepID=UPI000F7978D2|nr:hypothetical protein [Companilactobacillus furfuricola]
MANKLRLLSLSDEVLESLANEKISTRHGRELLRLDQDQQNKALAKILDKSLNVKETKALVDKYTAKEDKSKAEDKDVKASDTAADAKPKKSSNEYNINTSIEDVKANIAKMKKHGTSVSFVEDKKKGFYEIDIRIHDDDLED